MNFTTLVEPEDLHRHLGDPNWVVFDCRFDLSDPAAGLKGYEQEHIPGAYFLDLDTSLSGPVQPGTTGRHPLPDPETFAEVMRHAGVNSATQVVAYDGGSGAMCAARLWWLLQWTGHRSVAVLNGGLSAWRALGLGVQSERPAPRAAGDFSADVQSTMVVHAEEVARLNPDHTVLVDSRAADRYRGENESIDPVAGHIPGAVSHPFARNVDAEGRMTESDQLRSQFAACGATADHDVVFYCGSGVTAAHNALAFTRAYGVVPRLYAGSWSEWITDPAHPVQVGPNP